jgi:hypothetical protein
VAPFPANVTCGKIKVQVYGQTGNDQRKKVPVPVSVRTSALLNRASLDTGTVRWRGVHTVAKKLEFGSIRFRLRKLKHRG